jgi:hypothetical protein
MTTVGNRRLLVAAFVLLGLLYLLGVALNAPSPWPWAGAGAAVALAAYAALAGAAARPLGRWSLVAGCLVVAAWSVAAAAVARRPDREYLEIVLLPGRRTLTSSGGALEHSLSRTGPLLLGVGCLVVALAVAIRRVDAPRHPRLAVAIAVIGAVAATLYTRMAVQDRVHPWSGATPMWPLAWAVVGEALLILLAVAGVTVAAWRGSWFGLAGMALVAVFAVAGFTAVLDRMIIDVIPPYVPGNTAAPQLALLEPGLSRPPGNVFLEPGFVYGLEIPDTAPSPFGPALRLAALLAGIGLAVFGGVRLATRGDATA